MILLYLVGIALVVALVYVGCQLRYAETRTVLLDLIAYLKGIKTKWVTDPGIAQKVLQASDSKGVFVEQMLAMSAWAPILSLESVDGDQWYRMKNNFLLLAKHLPSTNELSEITTRLVDETIKSERILDADCIVELSLKSFVQWLFNVEFKPEWSFVIEATW